MKKYIVKDEENAEGSSTSFLGKAMQKKRKQKKEAMDLSTFSCALSTTEMKKRQKKTLQRIKKWCTDSYHAINEDGLENQLIAKDSNPRAMATLLKIKTAMQNLDEKMHDIENRHQPPPAIALHQNDHILAHIPEKYFKQKVLLDDDEQDDLEISTYLAEFKRRKKFNPSAIKIQATWKMYRTHRVFRRWKLKRAKMLKNFFIPWSLSHRTKCLYEFYLKKRVFASWAEEVKLILKLQNLELKIFEGNLSLAHLPGIVTNLFLTSKALPEEKSLPQSKSKSFCTVNAAYEKYADHNESRVAKLRRVHSVAYKKIGKKFLHSMFNRWKSFNMARKRRNQDAQLCLKRALRITLLKFNQPTWNGERVSTMFEMWHRYTVFRRCKIYGGSMPTFELPFPRWDAWVKKYQEKRYRILKASTMGPTTWMKRYFGLWTEMHYRSKIEKYKIQKALSHYTLGCKWNYFISWRAGVAEQVCIRAKLESVMLAWQDYCVTKINLKPIKYSVKTLIEENLLKKMWKTWENKQWRKMLIKNFKLNQLVEKSCENNKFAPVKYVAERILYAWCGEKLLFCQWRCWSGWKRYHHRRVKWKNKCFNVFYKERFKVLTDYFYSWKYTSKGQQRNLELSESQHKFRSFAFKWTNNLSLKLKRNRFSVPASDFGDILHKLITKCDVLELRSQLINGSPVDYQDENGNTPLHCTLQSKSISEQQQFEILVLLLESGANIHLRNLNQLTPLDICLDQPKIESSILFLSHPARLLRLFDPKTTSINTLDVFQTSFTWNFFLCIWAALSSPNSSSLSINDNSWKRKHLPCRRQSLIRREFFNFGMSKDLWTKNQIASFESTSLNILMRVRIEERCSQLIQSRIIERSNVAALPTVRPTITLGRRCLTAVKCLGKLTKNVHLDICNESSNVVKSNGLTEITDKFERDLIKCMVRNNFTVDDLNDLSETVEEKCKEYEVLVWEKNKTGKMSSKLALEKHEKRLLELKKRFLFLKCQILLCNLKIQSQNSDDEVSVPEIVLLSQEILIEERQVSKHEQQDILSLKDDYEKAQKQYIAEVEANDGVLSLLTKHIEVENIKKLIMSIECRRMKTELEIRKIRSIDSTARSGNLSSLDAILPIDSSSISSLIAEKKIVEKNIFDITESINKCRVDVNETCKNIENEHHDNNKVLQKNLDLFKGIQTCIFNIVDNVNISEICKKYSNQISRGGMDSADVEKDKVEEEATTSTLQQQKSVLFCEENDDSELSRSHRVDFAKAYAKSLEIIFKEEREELLVRKNKIVLDQKKEEETFMEKNPVTGIIDGAPRHLSIMQIADKFETDRRNTLFENSEEVQNINSTFIEQPTFAKKKFNQKQYLINKPSINNLDNYFDSKDSNSVEFSSSDNREEIHGIEFEFGNFAAVCASNHLVPNDAVSEDDNFSSGFDENTTDYSITEMWKSKSSPNSSESIMFQNAKHIKQQFIDAKKKKYRKKISHTGVKQSESVAKATLLQATTEAIQVPTETCMPQAEVRLSSFEEVSQDDLEDLRGDIAVQPIQIPENETISPVIHHKCPTPEQQESVNMLNNLPTHNIRKNFDKLGDLNPCNYKNTNIRKSLFKKRKVQTRYANPGYILNPVDGAKSSFKLEKEDKGVINVQNEPANCMNELFVLDEQFRNIHDTMISKVKKSRQAYKLKEREFEVETASLLNSLSISKYPERPADMHFNSCSKLPKLKKTYPPSKNQQNHEYKTEYSEPESFTSKPLLLVGWSTMKGNKEARNEKPLVESISKFDENCIPGQIINNNPIDSICSDEIKLCGMQIKQPLPIKIDTALSKRPPMNKKKIWGDFLKLPASSAVDGAYAEIYPDIYRREVLLQHEEQAPQVIEGTFDTKKGDLELWNNIEGFKSLDYLINTSGEVISKKKWQQQLTKKKRKKAREIIQTFCVEGGTCFLPWLNDYNWLLNSIVKQANNPPPDLFDELQRIVQLRIVDNK